jgi:thiaminase
MIYPDMVDHILGKHSKEVEDLYREYIEDYLSESLGELNTKSKSKLTKELLKLLIH